jgi:recombination protein RecA
MNVEKLRAKLKTELKVDIIQPMADARIKHTYLPSGIADLDLKLGGGWPIGRLNVLYGAQSSGKSIIALLTIANAQKFCIKCCTPFDEKTKCACKKCQGCKTLYVDAENYWTNEWATAIGIKEEDVFLAHPRHLEEAFDIVDIFLREEAVDVIVFDSIAGLSPKGEKEGTMEEWQTGLIPRVYTKFLRKWGSDLKELEAEGRKLPMTLIINQIRKKVGVMYGNPEIMPGGDAQYFAATTIVRATKKGIEMSHDKADPQPMYQTIRFKVEKSKASPVHREGVFEVAINKYLDKDGKLHNIGDIDNVNVLMTYVERFELLTGKSGEYVLAEKPFKTKEEIELALKDDVKFRWAVHKLVEKAYGDYVPSAVVLKKRKLDEAESEEEAAPAAP